jgi:arginyl-tRNA synthetase
VIFAEGFNVPLIVVKKDGGYNYASTDLTALKLVILMSHNLSIRSHLTQKNWN